MENTVVLKIISPDLILLSKLTSVLKAQFNPESVSRIMADPATKTFFEYIHFSEKELANKLKAVSAFPEGA